MEIYNLYEYIVALETNDRTTLATGYKSRYVYDIETNYGVSDFVHVFDL